MNPIEFALAIGVLLSTASIGVVAHEFAHALVLRAFGISYCIEWFPDDGSPVRAAAAGAFARVTPVGLSPDVPAWQLRAAAMAPLVLASPLALVAVGVVPDPFATRDPYLAMVAVGLLACAVPSPADFSLVWHAERTIVVEAIRDDVDDRP